MSLNVLKPKTVTISEFKAKCLAMIDEMNKTKQPLRVTRRGKPVADLTPPPPEEKAQTWLGSMAGEIKIVGDIVAPTGDLEDWEAWRD